MNYALGCFFGQMIGDALGSRYEFDLSNEVKHKIKSDIINNKLELLGGGPFNLNPGQVTDDTELALALAHSLINKKTYDKNDIAKNYMFWFYSVPFDIGKTTSKAFGFTKNYDDIMKNSLQYNKDSQSNGFLMRISPLAIYGTKISDIELRKIIKIDCYMTNPNDICVDAATVYVFTIRELIKTNGNIDKALSIAYKECKTKTIKTLLDLSKDTPCGVPIMGQQNVKADERCIGYFGHAFINAFYHLRHKSNFYTALINTIKLGGDTDTNGCICGALIGAMYGINLIPQSWIKQVMTHNLKYNRINNYPLLKIDNYYKFVNDLYT